MSDNGHVLFVLGVLVIVVGVALSIALHEIGHLVPAKKFGVKVTQYMVGFGPTIWSRKRGETEYGIKAIPLGGYVRMIGMLPPRPGDAPGQLRDLSTGRFSQMVDQARADSMQQVEPGDEDRVFYKLSPGKKIIIMLGGPVMNLVIAFVLMTGVITLFGLPKVVPTVGELAQCVPTAVPTIEQPQPKCAAGDPQAPSAASGLRAGDTVVAIDGSPITEWAQVTAAIRANTGVPMSFEVERDGARQTLRVTPVQLDRVSYDAQDKVVVDAAGNPVLTRVGFLGVVPTRAIVRTPLAEAPAFFGNAVAQTAGIVLKIPEKMVGVVQATFGSGARDPNGPISVVGVGRIGGEVAALEVPPEQGGNWLKIANLILLIASLNLALFIFNLIPLMPLDGGHVAGALWETVKKGWAKVRNQPDPGYVDVAKGLPIAYGVSIVLIGMSVMLIVADIVNPVSIFG